MTARRVQEVRLPVAEVAGGLPGTLVVPDAPRGAVIFCHGSGSSRLSPRNRAVAAALQGAGFATLLFDLLSAAEDREPALRFDIPRLADRVVAAVDWAAACPELAGVPLGLFGASTGAAAALVAAAERPGLVRAVVSRGGRPDLAAGALARVRCPTLLIVGGADPEVLALNERAFRALRCENALSVVPGATHLFEEPGAMEEVVRLAADWFGDALRPQAP